MLLYPQQLSWNWWDDVTVEIRFWLPAGSFATSVVRELINYFLINIATEQVAPLKAFLAEHQIVPESFYPVVRARLTAINDKPTEGFLKP